MERDLSESLCVCGRSFLQPSALTNHQRTCQSSKKRLSSALGKAKQLWEGRKRRRLQTSESDPELNRPRLPAGLVYKPNPATLVSSIEVCSFLLDPIDFHY